MAIIAKFTVSGCSLDTYQTVLKELDAAGIGRVPMGQIFHVCYGARDNVQVIDVFDTPASLENFGKALAPLLEKHKIKAEADVQEVLNILP